MHIFGCAAYVFLLADIRADKLAPKSELMVYLGVAPGNDANFLFMRSPHNILFTTVQAKFLEAQFPKCDKPIKWPTQVPTDIPTEQPIEALIPLVEDSPPPSHPSSLDLHSITPPAAPTPVRQPPAPRKQRPPPPAVPPAPCHSGREQRIPVHLDNIYGDDCHLTEQVHDIEREDHNAHQQPLPGQFPNTPAPPPPTADTSKDDVKRLCHEGGSGLATYLLFKALPAVSAENKSIHKWTYRDIQTLLSDQQKEWRKACTTELDMLRQRDMFELINAPKGRKVINNWWVFNIKPNGHKCARLVAKGFSQVEGIDFDQVFSPVI